MRIHFVNENVHGHATMHTHLRAALAERPDVDASFFDVPPASLLRRAFGAPVPGLGRYDLDLHPLRDQLGKSWTVRRHLDAERLATIDALHLYTHNAALLSVPAMRAVPAVVSLDCTNRQNAFRIPHRPPTRFTRHALPLTVAFERRVYGAARQVVAHSRWAADSLLGYGVPASLVHVIPFGIALPPPPPEPRRDGGLPRIVFIGQSMERKGGWRLLRIWRQWLADRSRLLLVTHEPVAPEPGLEVRNDIRPGDGQIGPLLEASTVLAMPSEIDAFGYALLEAMAAGLPVVAPRQAAVGEIVDDGVTGIVVLAGDDRAMAAALGELVDDAAAGALMGKAGRRRVEERFDARVTTAALLDVITLAAGA